MLGGMNETFWVAVAFLCFIALVFKPVKNFVLQKLDARTHSIKHELDRALQLKEEAQTLLASYQRKQREVEKDIEQILENAEHEAQRINKEGKTSLESALDKRVAIAMQKVSTYESAMLQQMRDRALNASVEAVRSLIVDRMDENITSEMVENVVSDIRNKLH